MGAAQTDGVFAVGESVEELLVDFNAFSDYSLNKNNAPVDILTSSCWILMVLTKKRIVACRL